jgi:hypothetical protein
VAVLAGLDREAVAVEAPVGKAEGIGVGLRIGHPPLVAVIEADDSPGDREIQGLASALTSEEPGRALTRCRSVANDRQIAGAAVADFAVTA